MSYKKFRDIKRKKTKEIKVGSVKIGGDNPISVQSMTNTLTTNVRETIKQINDCAEEGAELVRVSCPDEQSTNSLKEIVKNSKVPIIADIHFHYQRAIEAAEAGAACLRINPGNIGKKEKVEQVVAAAKSNNCSIRVGVNAGSLEKDLIKKYYRATPEALLESALRHIKILEEHKFYNTKISVKASNVNLAIDAYKLVAKNTSYPLHLGITEAGGLIGGTVKSALGLGALLSEGIGDTLRVSLSDNPAKEVKVGIEILKSLGIRKSGLSIISCPSCARQQFDVIDTVKKIEEKYENIKQSIKVSILGCVVNGPGEAKHTEIGLAGGGNNSHQIYLNGKKSHICRSDNLFDELSKLIDQKISLNE